jgi:nucleoside-diphosphate-sugar epimerase
MTPSLATTKILVTGATGFIGLRSVLHLLQCGYSVRVLNYKYGCAAFSSRGWGNIRSLYTHAVLFTNRGSND